jgi:MFS family permease
MRGFRNVIVVSLAYFLLKGGEELWNGFLPKYMEALGASVLVIGLFAALKDLLDAVYQYPGGALAEHIGSQRALMLANGLALAGYALYWWAPSWPWLFLGLCLVMAWESFSLPPTFALIGQSLPSAKRATGFSVQATMKRLPVMVAPPLGGWMIAHWGVVQGVRGALLFTLLLGAVALLVQRRLYQTVAPLPSPQAGGLLERYRSWTPELRHLLAADILARICEGLSETFAVLYMMNIVGLGPLQFGSLVTTMALFAILAYLPAGPLAERWGRFPLVVVTFIFFAAFPLAVWAARGYLTGLLAFVIGGLREFGEPARKALITDLGGGGRDYGLYYLLRGLAVCPAALVGGWLWLQAPWLPFVLSGAVGLCGVGFYVVSHPSRIGK